MSRTIDPKQSSHQPADKDPAETNTIARKTSPRIIRVAIRVSLLSKLDSLHRLFGRCRPNLTIPHSHYRHIFEPACENS